MKTSPFLRRASAAVFSVALASSLPADGAAGTTDAAVAAGAADAACVTDAADAGSADSADQTFAGDWDVVEGEGITVTGEPPVSAHTDVITREDIDAYGGADALSILEKTLGISVTRSGGYGSVSGFSLRGFGSGRVAILIDGMPVNSAQSGSFDLSTIDPATIEKIEVTYGGSDSRFGASGAVGGTVNVVTKTDMNKGFGASFDVSNLAQLPAPESRDIADAQRASASLRGGTGAAGWSASSFATRAGNAFAYEDLDGATRRREGNRVLDAGTSASFALALPSGSSLDFSVSAYGADREVPGALHAGSNGTQTDFALIDRARLDLRRAGSDRVSTDASLMHTLSRTTWEDRASTSLHTINTVSAANRWSVFASDELQLSAAADARWSTLSSTNAGTASRADGGVNAAAEWYASGAMTVAPSARLVVSGAGVIPVPRLGLLWKPSPSSALEFRHNAFRVYKLPNFNDLYWSGDATARGNPDLKSEDGFGADSGVAWSAGDALAVELTAYASWHRDAIQWQSANGVWSPANVGEAVFIGVDAKASAKPLERARVSLVWSFLDSRVLTGAYEFADGKRIPYQPMHRVNLDAAWITEKTEVRARAHYESERFTTVVNVARLDPFVTVGASVSRKLNGNWTAYAEGDNLLGASYVTVEGYPMPRATVTVGCKAAFGAFR